MDKTVVVETERVFRHPFYHKVVRRNSRFKAHDAKNECNVGDLVEIMETKPISRDKRWRLVKILGQGKVSGHERPAKAEKKEEEVKTEAAN